MEGGGQEDHITCFSEILHHRLHCRVRYTLAGSKGLHSHRNNLSSNGSGRGHSGSMSSRDETDTPTDDNTAILHLWAT